MRSVLRTFLATLALLSLEFCGSAAHAGMVATPVPDPGCAAGRAAGLEGSGAGADPAILPASDLPALAGPPCRSLRAGSDAGIALLVIGIVVVFAAVIVVVLIVDRARRHRRHLRDIPR